MIQKPNGDAKYWWRRVITPNLKSQVREKLLKLQNYQCNVCGATFLPNDIIETNYIKLITKGGSHQITNLQLLHAVCHDKKGKN